MAKTEARVHSEFASGDRESAAPAHLALAQALEQIGRRDAAIALYEAAVASDPAAIDAHLGLARVLLAAGRAAEAFRRADEALALDAEHVGAWTLIGEALDALGEPNLSAQAFERAVARRQGDALRGVQHRPAAMRDKVGEALLRRLGGIWIADGVEHDVVVLPRRQCRVGIGDEPDEPVVARGRNQIGVRRISARGAGERQHAAARIARARDDQRRTAVGALAMRLRFRLTTFAVANGGEILVRALAIRREPQRRLRMRACVGELERAAMQPT